MAGPNWGGTSDDIHRLVYSSPQAFSTAHIAEYPRMILKDPQNPINIASLSLGSMPSPAHLIIASHNNAAADDLID
jgi:hypothetical protein